MEAVVVGVVVGVFVVLALYLFVLIGLGLKRARARIRNATHGQETSLKWTLLSFPKSRNQKKNRHPNEPKKETHEIDNGERRGPLLDGEVWLGPELEGHKLIHLINHRMPHKMQPQIWRSTLFTQELSVSSFSAY